MSNYTAPQNDCDLSVTINERPIRVVGWHDRHQDHAKIRQQIDKCDGTKFQLLFRGMKKIPYEPELFVLGLKAKPMYATGNPEALTRHARNLAADAKTFARLAEAFAASPMMTKHSKCSTQALMNWYESSQERPRVRLAQLLLYGLQYQNTRQGIAGWRDYLFVLSATTTPDVAVRYALGHRHNESAPDCAVVIEYAPPCGGHCFEMMNDILEEFHELKLGEWFPDRDSEVLIPFAMLPHYVLGYAKLSRASTNQCEGSYSVKYVPNPAFATEGFSLDNPKDLDAEQERKRKELNGQIAWAYHRWTGISGEWFVLKTDGGDHDIKGAGPA